jgi:hypothetical protein
MLATGTQDIPAILTGLGALVTACAAAWSIVRNGHKIDQNHEVVKAIDVAVNGRGAGSTISDDIAALRKDLPASQKAAGVVLDAAKSDETDLRTLIRQLTAQVEANTKVLNAKP